MRKLKVGIINEKAETEGKGKIRIQGEKIDKYE